MASSPRPRPATPPASANYRASTANANVLLLQRGRRACRRAGRAAAVRRVMTFTPAETCPRARRQRLNQTKKSSLSLIITQSHRSKRTAQKVRRKHVAGTPAPPVSLASSTIIKKQRTYCRLPKIVSIFTQSLCSFILKYSLILPAERIRIWWPVHIPADSRLASTRLICILRRRWSGRNDMRGGGGGQLRGWPLPSVGQQARSGHTGHSRLSEPKASAETGPAPRPPQHNKPLQGERGSLG